VSRVWHQLLPLSPNNVFLIGVTYLGSSRVFNCKVIDNTCQETRSSYLATSIFESWFCPFGKGTSFFLLINFYLSGFICDEPLYSLFCACDISESLQDVIKGMGSLWIICLFTVILPKPYGLPSSVDLGCLGLCLFGWSTYSLVGGRAGALVTLSFGRWCLLASCGAYGGSGTTERSRIKKERSKNSRLFSFSPFSLGQLLI
jgi:hypothetical protein